MGNPVMTSGGFPKRGFTLVELMVVITILVLLAALLMPMLSSALDMARQPQCLNNMRQIYSLNQQYMDANNGYVVPAGISTGYLIDPYGNWGHENFQSNMIPPHSWDWAGNGVSFDAQLLVFLGIGLDRDYTWEAAAKARIFQCQVGPWGCTEKGWGELGAYNSRFDWIPTHPLDNDTGHRWSGHYALNIHTNYDPYDYRYRSWDGATWVGGNPDPRAPAYGQGWSQTYGGKFFLDGVGLKGSQWQDPGGTIFAFETWRNFGWSHPWSSQNCWYAGGPMESAHNAGMTGIFEPHELAFKIWQEKHMGKANLMCADGHGVTKYMRDTVGTGSMKDWRNVRGMWTHAAGD